MRIIPVIDLRGGRAVRGRSGRRDRYRPVSSRLGSETRRDLSDPRALLAVYRATLCPDTLYVADLDRIAGRGDNDAVVRRLAEDAPGLRILWDGGLAGVSTPPPAPGIVPVIGTETLRSLAALRRAPRPGGRRSAARARVRHAARPPGPRPVLSLDLLRGDRVLAGAPRIAALAPRRILAAARRRGVRTAILLLLDRVGTGSGVPVERLRPLRRAFPDVELLVGGGIASVADLKRLRDAEFDGALLATALHDRRIALVDLQTSSRDEAGSRGATWTVRKRRSRT